MGGRSRHALLLAAAAGASGCAGTFTAVSPDEIPALEARVAREPSDGEARHRYAAALFTAGRCDDASEAARGAMLVDPDNVVGPLIVGRCLEADGRYDDALGVYAAFRAQHPDASGMSAIEGQERIAQRARAVQAARIAIAADSTRASGPADPAAVAVLPLIVAGDSAYASLSRGLASMMLSDLDLLRRFRLVERLEVEAVMDELALARSAAVDRRTAARVGRIIRAGRTVQGTADVASEERTRLAAAVVTDVGGPEAEVETVEVEGRLEDLPALEKELVFAVADAMGYTPTLAERQLILDNGTESLLAFLSFSRGLEAQQLGDYASAAAHFREAAARDPAFTQATTELAVTSAAQVVSTSEPGQITSVGGRADDAVAASAGAVRGARDAMASSIFDVAGLEAERITRSTDGTDASRRPGALTGIDAARADGLRSGLIRIVIIIP